MTLIDSQADIELGASSTFGWVLMVTLTQRSMLNIVLAIYIGVVFGVLWLIWAVRGSGGIPKLK